MSSDPATGGGRVIMTRGLVALFAVACGVCVANLYYSQPLLPLISDNLGSSAGSTALVVTAAQIGYLLGLLFFVPLGDMLVRRRLIPFVMAADAVFLVATAFAPSLYFLIAVTVFVGVAATSAQILVPFAASLAEPERRGSVTGTVMSGLLLGILLARVFSGLIAEVTSWRPVYLIAAALMAILAVVLHRRLPDEEARPTITYGALLRSVANYFRSQRLLQLRSAYGGLVFATFSVIWTSLAFLLVRPPYNYSAATIGLFSLFGVAGALAAAFSGRLADRGWEHRVTGGGLLLLVVSVALLDIGSHELIALIAGIIFADLAINAVHIQNQQVIFGIDPAARSRINTSYMVCYFLGGAIGSAGAGLAWELDQWSGVVLLGLVFSGLAFLLWVIIAIAGSVRGASSPVAPVAGPE